MSCMKANTGVRESTIITHCNDLDVQLDEHFKRSLSGGVNEPFKLPITKVSANKWQRTSAVDKDGSYGLFRNARLNIFGGTSAAGNTQFGNPNSGALISNINPNGNGNGNASGNVNVNGSLNLNPNSNQYWPQTSTSTAPWFPINMRNEQISLLQPSYAAPTAAAAAAASATDWLASVMSNCAYRQNTINSIYSQLSNAYSCSPHPRSAASFLYDSTVPLDLRTAQKYAYNQHAFNAMQAASQVWSPPFS